MCRRRHGKTGMRGACALAMDLTMASAATITLADAAGGSYAVWLGPAATDGRFAPAAPASPLGALFSAGPPRAVAVDQRAACAREIAGRPLSDRPRCFAFQRGVAGASRRFPAR